MATFVHLILTLSRASNLPTVWTNCIAAWTLNQAVNYEQGWNLVTSLEWGVLGWVLLGGSLAYSGGCILNDAFDQKFDAEFNPNRPVPSGQISSIVVWMSGSFAILLGTLVLLMAAKCATIWVSLLILAIIIYDILHKKWSGSVWIMGSCRTFLWLVAATAGSNIEIHSSTLTVSIILGLYVVGISLFARGEARGNSDNKNILPVLLLFLPCLYGIYALFENEISKTNIFLPVLFGLLLLGWKVYRAVQIIRRRKKPADIGAGVSILLASICLIDGLAICLHFPPVGILCYFGFLFSVILQKRFAAT